MIKINKPGTAPKTLNGKGAEATEALKQAFDRGEKEFSFNSKIYGAKSVKNKLLKVQHKKCAFCERSIYPGFYGDVEHFRPKGGYKQNEEDELAQPGYYWLAYDWSNLYASCQWCNQRFKKNLFPIQDGGRRAINHHHSIDEELPLLINPGLEDPEDSISFRGEVPFSDNDRGKRTIAVLGLDSKELCDYRSDSYQRAKYVFDILRLCEPGTEIHEKAKSFLNSCTEDASEFASMFRSAIRNKFKYKKQ